MTATVKKSTKKFQKRHLKNTLDRRKETAKIKQRAQVKAKRKAQRAEDRGEDVPAAPNANGAKKESKSRELSGMSVDEFFQDGFEVPLQKNAKNGKVTEDEDEEMDEDEDEDDVGHDFETHQQDLQALKKSDPEFYKFLNENDAELLDFQQGDDDELQLSADEDGTQEQAGAKEKTKPVVTKEMIEKWRVAMAEQHSLRAMRQAMIAFRAAVFLNSEDEKKQKYTIADPDTYHQVLVTTMQNLPAVLNHHLPVKESAAGKARVATDSKKFRSLSPLLQSHANAVLRLLSDLSDAPTIKLTLSSLTPILPYFLSYKKLVKTMIKAVVDIYTTTAGSEEATLVTAFLLLRRLAIISDPTIRETVLKQTYQGLVKGTRVTNSHTISFINLMKNSCVDLWALEPELAYMTGFIYIRQLAIHLRSSIVRPTKESYKMVYNWQYIHSLDFWSRLLSATCSPQANPLLKSPKDSPLHPLIYPVVQITLGALRLIPTPAYFPLRFHLTRSLLRISRTTQTYIPLAPSLLEVLSSPELSKPAKPSTLPPLDFNTTLRAPKSSLRSRTYQTGLGEQVHDLLTEFFACWAKNIAFPELIIPPYVMLKRWLKSVSSPPSTHAKKSKGNQNGKLNSALHTLLSKMNDNAAFVEQHRRTVTFSPTDRSQVDLFLRDVPLEATPLGAYLKTVHDRAQQRERVLEQSRRTHENRDHGNGDDVDQTKNKKKNAKRNEKVKAKKEEDVLRRALKQKMQNLDQDDNEEDEDEDEDEDDIMLSG